MQSAAEVHIIYVCAASVSISSKIGPEEQGLTCTVSFPVMKPMSPVNPLVAELVPESQKKNLRLIQWDATHEWVN